VITGIDHVQVAAPPGCEPAARFYVHDPFGNRLELLAISA
jgi:hypothetical protein